MFLKIKLSFFLLLVSSFLYSQEGIPVYSDYLSDNYYLIHPSMAGAANCAKLRLTVRKQWIGEEEAPTFQTLSFNGRVGEKSGAGVILFNDKNGYHSQKGFKGTYAYHILFSRDEIDLNQLSFGISSVVMQNQLDERLFVGFDPVIAGNIQTQTYFNTDIGASYNYRDFYLHATVQNILETKRKLYSDFESDNIRKYLLSFGYILKDNKNLLWEPSILFQVIDKTREKLIDANLKVYKNLDFGSIWMALSYRKILDKTIYYKGSTASSQNLKYLTPILGINYKNLMFAYTYSQIIGEIKFENTPYHQITLGLNLFCKKEKYDCDCPAVN